MTFYERLMAVTGGRPYEWAKEKEFSKSKMTSLTRLKNRPHKGTLVELVRVSGIPADWWLGGNLPPPNVSGSSTASYPSAIDIKERRASSVEEPATSGYSAFDAAVFSRCRQACQAVHGDEFGLLPQEVQEQYAGELYSLIGRLAFILGQQISDALKPGPAELAGFLSAAHQMGWVRRFPDQRHHPEVRQA